MHILFPQQAGPSPNGVVVRSIGDLKSFSMWCGDTELIATIDKDQAERVSRALADKEGVFQIVGPVRLFNIPKITF